MNIHSIRAWREKLPLTKPYTIAYKTISETEIIFLEITLENGIRGYGAANPFPEVVGETAAETLANLQSDFMAGFRGKNIHSFHELIDATEKQFPNRPGTLAAIDIALHDAFCKQLRISVLRFYGQKTAPLLTSVTIGIKGIDEMLEEAAGYHALGFRVLKLKTGHSVEEDIERVKKVTERFGRHFTIRVDANQGYSIAQVEKFLTATEGEVEVIEQPLTAGADTDLQRLSDEQRRLLVADESLRTAQDAFTLAQPPLLYGVYNIKLMKCGGVKAAREIGMLASRAGIDLFWGCNDESIISIAAALHAAYSCANTKYLDLDGSFDLSKDLVEGGFRLKDGYMLPVEGAGFGFSPIGEIGQ